MRRPALTVLFTILPTIFRVDAALAQAEAPHTPPISLAPPAPPPEVAPDVHPRRRLNRRPQRPHPACQRHHRRDPSRPPCPSPVHRRPISPLPARPRLVCRRPRLARTPRRRTFCARPNRHWWLGATARHRRRWRWRRRACSIGLSRCSRPTRRAPTRWWRRSPRRSRRCESGDRMRTLLLIQAAIPSAAAKAQK